jgi:nucleotide-binding universal stress UspA family protein
MRTILVHIEDSPGLGSMLASALLAARRFGSHIEGMRVPPSTPAILPLSPEGGLATADVMASLERGAELAGQRLREDFARFIRDHDLVETELGMASDAPTVSWYEPGPADSTTFASHGRVFDLIVVGRPQSGAIAPSMVILEEALFESGRPLLIAPPRVPAVLGERVAIAWNGSTETARTVAFAMPFLKRAQEIVVVSVEEAMVPGPSGRELAQNLTRHGLPVRWRHVHAEGRNVGAAMLAESTAAGADLVVKGAYTQSRLRQMIFGGATSHILAHAELPVLMAH